MKVFDKTGNQVQLVATDNTFNSYHIKKLTSLDDVNYHQVDDSGSGYGMGMGVIDNIGFLSFYFGWMCIQLKLDGTEYAVMIRFKYGNSAWTDWTKLTI